MPHEDNFEISEQSDAGEVAGRIASGFVDSWNRHDMTSLVALFHDNAAFVNVVGVHMRGRDEIEHHHTVAHAGPFQSSTLNLDVEDASEIVPGVVVAHARSALHGDTRDPGSKRESLLTLVIERRAGLWKITAAHNTNIPMERA